VSYSADEKETVCVFDYVANEWNVYSCVPRHMTKLRRIAEPYWEEKNDNRVTAGKWKLKGNQVRFAVEIISSLTDEQKEAARLRMAENRKK